MVLRAELHKFVPLTFLLPRESVWSYCAKRFLHPLGPSDPMSVRASVRPSVRPDHFWSFFGPSCRVCYSLMSYFGVPKMVQNGTSGRSQIWDLADLGFVTNQLHSLTSASSRLPPRGLLSSRELAVAQGPGIEP